MARPELILASASSYRRSLLARLGVPFTVQVADCDEDAWKGRGSSPEELAEQLARAKAMAVAREWPEAAVIGSDQVCLLGERILGKPGGESAACRQLEELQGRTHRLITALCIRCGPREFAHTDVTTLHMQALNDQQVARYVAADQPYDCAGSYKLEERGIALFDSIESEDHSAITGLPLLALARILRELGFAIP